MNIIRTITYKACNRMVVYPQRNIFFMRRLQNKPVKKESNIQHQYDDDTYIKAMKKFQREARGVIPGTKEYDEIRNKVYAEMREEKAKSKNSSKQDIISADFSSYYSLLVVLPEETDGFETVHILNYFGFPFNVEEDNIFKQDIKKEMGFRPEDEYPLLLLDSSSKEMPNTEVVSKDIILKFLREKDLIGDYKTFSAFENQGLQFIEADVLPLMKDIFSDFRPLLQFYIVPKHLRKTQMNTQITQFLFQYMYSRTQKLNQYLGMKEKQKLSKKEKYQAFQKLMDQWVTRFKDQAFHGEKRPDAADFKMYSWLNKFMHTFTMKQLMNARGKEDKLLVWYDKMERACKAKTFF